MKLTTLALLSLGLVAASLRRSPCLERVQVVRLAQAAQDSANDESRGVRLGKVPAISLKERHLANEEEAKRIRSLIASLARIQRADFGLSATLSGTSFAPLGQTRFSSGLLTDHDIEPSEAMKELVHLGPKAVPFLLKALEDETPTKLVMEHKLGFGGMWYGSELGGNPANKREMAILDKNEKDSFSNRKTLEIYTVTVGDAAFVALGQIVGRPYSAVCYRPTACIIVNSPTQSSLLRSLVRERWNADRPDQALLDSLLLDYSTEGIFNGRSLDGWYQGSALQCAAALRLLYYFPGEASSLMVERLAKLDVMKAGDDGKAWMLREVKNGVRTVDFLNAVAWTTDPPVRAAISEIMKKTDESEIFRGTLPAIQGKDLPFALERLKAFLAALPKKDRGPFGEAYHLLIQLQERFPEDARPVFEGFLKDAPLQRHLTFCHVLRLSREEWANELLAPLLDDKRELEWGYGVAQESPLSSLSSRVCDEAAASIYAKNPDLVFLVQGDREKLDRQIEDMKKKITARKKK